MDLEDQSARWKPFRSYLSRKNLDSILGAISRYYTFISIDEAIGRLESGSPLDRHYCVITFDDGQKNCITHAMPILRRHKAPAVLYVVPDQIELQQPYWFDRIDYAMQHAFKSISEIDVFDKKFHLNRSSEDGLKELFLSIKKELFSSRRPLKEAIKELSRIIEKLEHIAGKSLLDIYSNDPWSRVMNWDEIKQASQENDITIGSHTLDHSLLGLISEAEVRDQLVKSKQAIEAHTHKPCIHFCYPNGSIPANPGKHLEESGYVSAVTTNEGISVQRNFERYLINRYHLDVRRGAVFNIALISGLIEVINRCAKPFRGANSVSRKNKDDNDESMI